MTQARLAALAQLSRATINDLEAAGNNDLGFAKDEGTDCMAVHEGYISVTPLQVDMTNHKLLREKPVAEFFWP